MIVHRAEPLNAETDVRCLAASGTTPQRDFYVRCHGPVPRIDVATYRLAVGGQGCTRPLALSLEDLRDGFPRRTVTAVLQCAGNRRADMAAVRPVSGDPWGPGAIGNAAWTGVSLGDVLRAAGREDGDEAPLHVAFACHDAIDGDESRATYGVSIPLAKAMAPETLIAVAMNGEPLAPEHGYPVRIVTPGYAGVRSPKWLAAIHVQAEPADTQIQRGAYKLFPAGVTTAGADPALGLTIDEMPLTSAILVPEDGARVFAGPLMVRGYAIAGGRAIARVEISPDDGRSWVQARCDPPAGRWSWTTWRAELDMPAGAGEIAVRAWTAAGETQPRGAAEIWNHAGYLSNAWHRVRLAIG